VQWHPVRQPIAGCIGGIVLPNFDWNGHALPSRLHHQPPPPRNYRRPKPNLDLSALRLWTDFVKLSGRLHR
jgi:hypothetical protein